MNNGKANKAPTKAAGKTAKATTNGRASYAPTDRVRFTKDGKAGNPKRPGTAAHALYALYKDGMSVADYVKAVKAGPARRDQAYVALRWDVDKGFITVG